MKLKGWFETWLNEQLHLERPCGPSSHHITPLSTCASEYSHCENKTGPGSDLSHKQGSPGSEACVTIFHSNMIKNKCHRHEQDPSPFHTKHLQLLFSDIFPFGYQTGFDLMFDDGSCADITGPSSKKTRHAHSIMTAKDSVVPGKRRSSISLKPN